MRPHTGPRTPRLLDPLLPDDVEAVTLRLGGARHNTARLDHEGPWRTCPGCKSAALYAAYALGAKARSSKQGWNREQALQHIAGPRTRVVNLTKDGERLRLADEGAPTRPEVAASAKVFSDAFDRAWATGRLSQAPHVATEVLRWVITFAGDPGESVTDGRTLPFDRIARTVVGGPDTATLTDDQVAEAWHALSPQSAPELTPEERVTRLWNEIEVACSSSTVAAAELDRLVASRSERLSTHTTLWVGGEGGERSLDEFSELTPIWVDDEVLVEGAVQWGGPTPSGEQPSELVSAAAARMVQQRELWRHAAPEDQQRVAATAVLDELQAQHGPFDADLADVPALDELANEVLAVAASAAA